MIRAAMILLLLHTVMGMARAASPFGELKQPVVASLVSSVDAIVPGETFKVGVVFDIAPHWHTYWINPGDTGMETRVKVTTPGFHAGPIRWPLPEAINVDGYVSFGYTERVMHILPVTAPADLEPGVDVALGFDVAWMVCHETCINGDARLSLTLPVRSSAEPVNTELFRMWESRLPVGMNTAAAQQAIASIKHSAAAAGDPADNFIVTWKGKAPPANVRWLPIPTRAVVVEDVQVAHEGNRTQVRFSKEVFDVNGVGDGMIGGVLMFTDAEGRRVGVDVPVRVSPAPSGVGK